MQIIECACGAKVKLTDPQSERLNRGDRLHCPRCKRLLRLGTQSLIEELAAQVPQVQFAGIDDELIVEEQRRPAMTHAPAGPDLSSGRFLDDEQSWMSNADEEPSLATDRLRPFRVPTVDDNLVALSGFVIVTLGWATYMTTWTGTLLIVPCALAGFVLCMIGWNRYPRSFAVAGATLATPVLIAMVLFLVLYLLAQFSDAMKAIEESLKEYFIRRNRQ